MSFTAETTHGVASVQSPLPAIASAQLHAKGNESQKEAKQAKRFSAEETQQRVQQINEQLRAMHTELSFSVDKATDKVVLKIVNSKTHEVIRQIPAEDALRISSHINRLLGLLVDESA